MKKAMITACLFSGWVYVHAAGMEDRRAEEFGSLTAADIGRIEIPLDIKAEKSGAGPREELNDAGAVEIVRREFGLEKITLIMPGEGKGTGGINGFLPGIGTPEVSVPVPASRGGNDNTVQPKEWTVMVFMNGNNDLMPFTAYNLGQISSVGTTDKVNVVVEMGLATWNEKGSVVSRMLVNKGTPDRPGAVVYNTWENRDMGDYRNVVDFAKWAMTNFPAKRYLLAIENHGGGIDDGVFKKPAAGKGISYDNISYNYIKTTELRQMMKEIGKVDIFLMNACLMQMAEVGYEIKDYTDMIVGSENVDHVFAFLYKEELSFLTKNPTAPSEEIAAAFVNEHKKFYAGETVFNPIYGLTMPNSILGHTKSAVKSSALNELPAQLDAWTAAVQAANEPEAVRYAVEKVLRFGMLDKNAGLINTYADLGHFVKLISAKSENDGLKTASAKLLGYITKDLVHAQNGMHKTEFYNFEDSTGIAIKMAMMLPKPIVEVVPEWDSYFLTRYPDLRLSKDSNWDEFLDWLQKTYHASLAG